MAGGRGAARLAAIMGGLFFGSAFQVLRQSWREFRSGTIGLNSPSLTHEH